MLSPEALSGLVSAHVSVGTCVHDELGDGARGIAEAAGLDRSASPRRRADFALGRLAARQALGGLGVQARSIPIGAQHQPVWPDGVTGSISHSAGAAVAVAARESHLHGIGVDLEARDRELSPRVAGRVLNRAERWALEGPTAVPWPLVLFCAKEAACKAAFQACGLRLEPGELAFGQPEAEASTGCLECRTEKLEGPIPARYALADRFVVACVELAR